MLGDRSMSATSLVEVLPVAHLEYAFAGVEYFGDIPRSDESADLASDRYLVGHARCPPVPTEGDGALEGRHPRKRASSAASATRRPRWSCSRATGSVGRAATASARGHEAQ